MLAEKPRRIGRNEWWKGIWSTVLRPNRNRTKRQNPAFPEHH